VQLSIFLIDLFVGTYRLSSHARLEAFVIQTKLKPKLQHNFTPTSVTLPTIVITPNRPRGCPRWLQRPTLTPLKVFTGTTLFVLEARVFSHTWAPAPPSMTHATHLHPIERLHRHHTVLVARIDLMCEHLHQHHHLLEPACLVPVQCTQHRDLQLRRGGQPRDVC